MVQRRYQLVTVVVYQTATVLATSQTVAEDGASTACGGQRQAGQEIVGLLKLKAREQ